MKVIMKCINIKLWDILGCFHYILNAPRTNVEVSKVRTTSYFVSTCTIFVDTRSRHLPANIYNVTTRDLLFGMDNKTNHENEALFTKVQEYIVKSGRFARN